MRKFLLLFLKCSFSFSQLLLSLCNLLCLLIKHLLNIAKLRNYVIIQFDTLLRLVSYQAILKQFSHWCFHSFGASEKFECVGRNRLFVYTKFCRDFLVKIGKKFFYFDLVLRQLVQTLLDHRNAKLCLNCVTKELKTNI